MEEIKESKKVTIKEFSEILGVHSSAVSKAISEGRMPQSVTIAANGKKSIDVRIGVEEFNQNKKRGAVNFSKKEGRRKADNSHAADSERNLKHYKAELARLEFEEAEGKLVDGDKIKRQAFKVARSVRDAILNIPDRVSAELAAERDQFIVHKRLTEEIRMVLESLSGKITNLEEPEEDEEIDASDTVTEEIE